MAHSISATIQARIVICFSVCALSCAKPEATRLALTPDMIINEVAKGNAALLIDEQSDDQPRTTWSIAVPVGEPEWYLPANAVIDLQQEHVITEVLLFDGDVKEGPCHINYGVPFQWQRLASDSMKRDNEWVSFPAQITTRYIQLSREVDADVREIVLYGYPVSGTPTSRNNETVRQRARIPLDEAIGVNTHYLDPMDKVKVSGIVREYHNWQLNEGGFTRGYPGYPDNAIQWNPASPMQKERQPIPEWNPEDSAGFRFDDYYAELKEAGIIVFPCIQGTVPWMGGDPDVRSRHKPVAQDGDPGDPASYEAHADFMFQYAARYGSNKVPAERLKVAPHQERKSGLGLLEYYENWNEPDGWWGGRRDYFTPYEYAAMSSADYDGHESSMGDDKGIRNADPGAKLVMSGIAIPNPDYLRAMKFWFEHNRSDRKFVFDVITVHHYCNERGSQASMTKGISPEEDDLVSLLKKITAFRDRYAPECEVWLTEFGWDTNPATPQSAATPEQQGDWLIRAYLEAFEAGMDRVTMYMLRDVNPKSTTQFTSSGLIGPIGDFSPKPSWYYVYTLRNQLTGLFYDGSIESGNPDVIVRRFSHPEGTRTVYALWSPLPGDPSFGYSLRIPGNPVDATLVRLAEGHKDGISSSLDVVGGTSIIPVSQKPVFVVVNQDVP